MEPGAVARVLERADQDAVRRDLAAYFGRGGERYLAYYEKMRAEGRPGNPVLTWNWTVFVFGAPWLFYRKLYLHGSAFLLLTSLASQSPALGSVRLLAATVVLAFAADWLYVREALRQIAQADAQGLADEERATFLGQAGGTSIVAAAFATLILLTLLSAQLLVVIRPLLRMM